MDANTAVDQPNSGVQEYGPAEAGSWFDQSNDYAHSAERWRPTLDTESSRDRCVVHFARVAGPDQFGEHRADDIGKAQQTEPTHAGGYGIFPLIVGAVGGDLCVGAVVFGTVLVHIVDARIPAKPISFVAARQAHIWHPDKYLVPYGAAISNDRSALRRTNGPTEGVVAACSIQKKTKEIIVQLGAF